MDCIVTFIDIGMRFIAPIIVLGIILFFSSFIIICRLGKISLTLQEINKKLGEKPEDDKVEDKSSAL